MEIKENDTVYYTVEAHKLITCDAKAHTVMRVYDSLQLGGLVGEVSKILRLAELENGRIINVHWLTKTKPL